MRPADALTCESCGAPLPPAEAGATVTCAHCGTAHVVGETAPTPSRSSKGMLTSIPMLVAMGGVILVSMAGVVLILLLQGGLALVNSRLSAPEPPRVAATPAPPEPPPPPKKTSLSPEDFAKTTPGGWKELDVDLGDLSDFEALEHLPTLLAACRVWSPDCELARLDLDHVRHDGHLDLVGADEADADYRFFSPSRQKAREELRAVSEDLPLAGFRVRIEDGEIRAMLDDREVDLESERGGAPWQPLGSTEGCDQAGLIARTRELEEVDKRPYYRLRLEWRTPYAGLPAWLWELQPGRKLWPDTCEVWDVHEARRRAR